MVVPLRSLKSLAFERGLKMLYFVEKRMINNYLVQVDAGSVEEAIRKATNGAHEPGELVSDNEDGDNFYPSAWRAYTPSSLPGSADGLTEITDVNRMILGGLD